MAKQILSLDVDKVSLDPENARKHTDVDVTALSKALAEFGQQTPIVVDGDNIVVKGNGTLLAAIKLGWKKIDAVRTTLDGQKLRAYAIADNQTALNSEWDVERLEAQIAAMDAELHAALGFQQSELDSLLAIDPVAEPVEVDAHERAAPDGKDDFSIRVDGVDPEHKDAIVDLINTALENARHAYRAAAF